MESETGKFCNSIASCYTKNEKNEDSDSEKSSTSFHSMEDDLEIELFKIKEPRNVSHEAFENRNDLSAEDAIDGCTTYSHLSKDALDGAAHISDEVDEYNIDEDYFKEKEISMTEEDRKVKHEVSLEKKTEGNNKFKENLFEEAALLYTEGLKSCPPSFKKDRAILYANRAAARSKLKKDGQMKGAIKDCDMAVMLDPSYIKALQRRANLHRQEDNLEDSLKDYQSVLQLDPQNDEAARAVLMLPNLIEEKNEKLKAEMLGKLKDLGNMILKPFGLSTENFQMNKNDETGGYSINFKQ